MKLQITGGVLTFDKADAPIVMAHSWYVHEHGYAISRINGRLVRLHKLLTGTDKTQHVDHKKGGGLDNRRSNIRMATRNQNMWNSAKKNRGGKRKTSSRFKGVNLLKRDSRWVAEVWKFGKKIFRKSFPDERSAAIAYNIVATREFGEFARLNNVRPSASETEEILRTVESYKPRGPSKGGGVSFHYKKWRFTKIINGKRRAIGSFNTRSEAEEARRVLHLQSTGGAPAI